MTTAHYNYGRLMQRAMRGLMAEVLGDVARNGLPGGHHFFITFATTHPGVDAPDWLVAQHPEELSIILQHEFDDLAVTSDRFSVRLSFGDRPATLVVPFDAVTTFADPSENFGLRFDAHDEGGDAGDDPAPDPPKVSEDRPPKPDKDAAIVSLDAFRKR